MIWIEFVTYTGSKERRTFYLYFPKDKSLFEYIILSRMKFITRTSCKLGSFNIRFIFLKHVNVPGRRGGGAIYNIILSCIFFCHSLNFLRTKWRNLQINFLFNLNIKGNSSVINWICLLHLQPFRADAIWNLKLLYFHTFIVKWGSIDLNMVIQP